jgi:hypothetical protein
MLSDVMNRGYASRERVRRPAIRRTATWLAVLALFAQTVLFDLAMAARETAAARERIAAAHATHHAPRDDRNAPQHPHGGEDCPFCVARTTHQASSLPTSACLPLPLSIAAVALPLPRGRARARRRPSRFRARSPPRKPSD